MNFGEISYSLSYLSKVRKAIKRWWHRCENNNSYMAFNPREYSQEMEESQLAKDN